MVVVVEVLGRGTWSEDDVRSGGGTDQRGSTLAAHHASLSSPVALQQGWERWERAGVLLKVMSQLGKLESEDCSVRMTLLFAAVI